MNRVLFAVACAAVAAGCGGPASTPDIAGHWEGSITVAGGELGILADFAGSGDSLSGTIDIPLQSAEGLHLAGVAVSGDSVRFDLAAGPGMASFRGTISDSSMTGTLSQAGFLGAFTLTRKRPLQEVERPYVMTEVTIPAGGFSLAGTLSEPSDTSTGLPGVVMLTGSGAQDRNENVFGFKVFDVIADYLTRQGFAVLRCDDRGVGGSGGATPDMTDSTLASDAVLMLEFMRSRPEIDSSKVGLFGHSEGSNIAFLAASLRPDLVAFVVSMAGPSVPGYDILLGQVEALARAAGKTDEEIGTVLSLQAQIMDSVLSGGSLDSLRPLIEDQIRDEIDRMPDAQKQALGDIDAYVRSAAEQSLETVGSPWFKRFLSDNPSDNVKKLTCPVLALFGSLDIQVPPALNEEPMRQALSANPRGMVMVFQGANHLFQQAVTGTVEEYATLPHEFVPGFLDSVGVWMKGAVLGG